MYPSLWQIVLVLVIFILLFGHKRIKELGKSLGEALRDFRKGLDNEESNKPNTLSQSSTKSPDDSFKKAPPSDKPPSP